MSERGVIIDTGIWIDHLHETENGVEQLLTEERALLHPMVYGELACGGIKARAHVLRLLSFLDQPEQLFDHAEALNFIEHRALFGKGLSYIDIHLLGAALLGSYSLWTRDRALTRAASDLSILWRGG